MVHRDTMLTEVEYLAIELALCLVCRIKVLESEAIVSNLGKGNEDGKLVLT